ncbi:uncharacterized protein VICG_01078 [Vittaforma corneae ATCC 50505]|uniref:Uncharacterized protein n=1 Tax=Vittaforma corneae (strain ATCC 50505) TaxID=993615 RepID=L2GMN1_VITCO|nr:uncharacterized protein VICG_01078 [Vittaforma corneae ATCC 50505]ELA41894.1 hypothetical protein VICG_01078 [Vittaforma corneae ATCC 50505]
MKNAITRASSFCSILMNCTVLLLFAIFITSYFYSTPQVTADLKVEWVSPNRNYKACQFFPNIDLTPQFNFNTKQVFLYLVAKSPENKKWSGRKSSKTVKGINFLKKKSQTTFSQWAKRGISPLN